MMCIFWNPKIQQPVVKSIQYFFLFSGADSLCGRLTEKLNSSDGHRLVLAHMPLLMVCLEVGVYIIWIYKWNYSWNFAIRRLSEKV